LRDHRKAGGQVLGAVRVAQDNPVRQNNRRGDLVGHGVPHRLGVVTEELPPVWCAVRSRKLQPERTKTAHVVLRGQKLVGRTKELVVDPIGGDARQGESADKCAKERLRAAQEDVRL
jgi:hypothetical protein